jgi:hypothetical protein
MTSEGQGHHDLGINAKVVPKIDTFFFDLLEKKNTIFFIFKYFVVFDEYYRLIK